MTQMVGCQLKFDSVLRQRFRTHHYTCTQKRKYSYLFNFWTTIYYIYYIIFIIVVRTWNIENQLMKYITIPIIIPMYYIILWCSQQVSPALFTRISILFSECSISLAHFLTDAKNDNSKYLKTNSPTLLSPSVWFFILSIASCVLDALLHAIITRAPKLTRKLLWYLIWWVEYRILVIRRACKFMHLHINLGKL